MDFEEIDDIDQFFRVELNTEQPIYSWQQEEDWDAVSNRLNSEMPVKKNWSSKPYLVMAMIALILFAAIKINTNKQNSAVIVSATSERNSKSMAVKNLAAEQIATPKAEQTKKYIISQINQSPLKSSKQSTFNANSTSELSSLVIEIKPAQKENSNPSLVADINPLEKTMSAEIPAAENKNKVNINSNTNSKAQSTDLVVDEIKRISKTAFTNNEPSTDLIAAEIKTISNKDPIPRVESTETLVTKSDLLKTTQINKEQSTEILPNAMTNTLAEITPNQNQITKLISPISNLQYATIIHREPKKISSNSILNPKSISLGVEGGYQLVDNYLSNKRNTFTGRSIFEINYSKFSITGGLALSTSFFRATDGNTKELFKDLDKPENYTVQYFNGQWWYWSWNLGGKYFISSKNSLLKTYISLGFEQQRNMPYILDVQYTKQGGGDNKEFNVSYNRRENRNFGYLGLGVITPLAKHWNWNTEFRIKQRLDSMNSEYKSDFGVFSGLHYQF
jgi:hypothetical protein